MSERNDGESGSPCPGCGRPARPILTELLFTDGDLTIRVEGVPAVVCEACGETFVDGPLGVRIGDEVAEVGRLLRPDDAGRRGRATEPRVVVLAVDRAVREAA